ncbi:MAG: hypothetical protein DHS20C17_13150 [Cyclobacteriaceae bacterium]|nr:MAG: hypothetical protein DHS20C17_13150 [Cyclobacteriaceae bacterium]
MVLRIQYFLSNLGSVITTIIRVLLLSNWRVQLNKPIADECVILANGPSLGDQINEHRQFLKNKDLICVNHFPSTGFYKELKPAFYVTSAPDLWLDQIDEFFVKQSNGLFKTMAGDTHWPLVFHIPYEARKFRRWQNLLKSNPKIKFVFYNNTPIEGWKWFRHLCFRMNLGMPRPHNVLIPCLTHTINMGYRRIYLWGADHSWLSEISVDQKNQVLINQKHFYDSKTSVGKPLDKRGVGQRNMPELLTKFVHAFNGYFVLREYAESLGITILNATPGSFIDAFERVDLKSLDDSNE